LSQAITSTEGFETVLADLLKDTEAGTKKVRLLGVALSSLHTSALLNYQQLDLFNIQFNKRGSLKAI
jgi:DNA polymerase-4